MRSDPSHGRALQFTAAAAALLAGACAHRAAEAPPLQVTSADLSAGYAERSVESEIGGSYAAALTLADRAVEAAPDNAWARYDRAVALHHLLQTDRAVAAYREAEAHFGDSLWGKSLAIYGRARALDDAGRCNEAKMAYGEFASLVQSSDAKAADMARSYASLCRADKTVRVDPVTSDVSTAVVARDYARALSLAKQAPDTNGSRPWLDYNRGVALAELRKTDEAVQAFEAAERGFAASDRKDPTIRWGRSVAIYGRARALDTADRCAEAKKAYGEYESFVQDRQAADVARAIAARCAAKP
jgi:tetratricopeptide (TPR) repeat protein